MNFTVENKQNGADNNVVLVTESNPYHLVVADRDYHSSGERYKGEKLYPVAHSPFEEDWFIYHGEWHGLKVPDSINKPEYWTALKEFIESPGFPQPYYCPERKKREMEAGMRAWRRGWNEANKGTGQAYLGV